MVDIRDPICRRRISEIGLYPRPGISICPADLPRILTSARPRPPSLSPPLANSEYCTARLPCPSQRQSPLRCIALLFVFLTKTSPSDEAEKAFVPEQTIFSDLSLMEPHARAVQSARACVHFRLLSSNLSNRHGGDVKPRCRNAARWSWFTDRPADLIPFGAHALELRQVAHIVFEDACMHRSTGRVQYL